jgi:predicted nucleotidyltransferase
LDFQSGVDYPPTAAGGGVLSSPGWYAWHSGYYTGGMTSLPTLTPELLAQMTEAIVQAVAPEQIVLFGSQARGTAGPHSDVDLLIIVREPFGPYYSRFNEINRVSHALVKFGVPTDVLLYTQQEVEDWKNSRNHITTRALREGRVIYDRSRSGETFVKSSFEGSESS